jgi:predicted naringenin-chalcone synthase
MLDIDARRVLVTPPGLDDWLGVAVSHGIPVPSTGVVSHSLHGDGAACITSVGDTMVTHCLHFVLLGSNPKRFASGTKLMPRVTAGSGPPLRTSVDMGDSEAISV